VLAIDLFVRPAEFAGIKELLVINANVASIATILI
jgi:hypothetical protein